MSHSIRSSASLCAWALFISVLAGCATGRQSQPVAAHMPAVHKPPIDGQPSLVATTGENQTVLSPTISVNPTSAETRMAVPQTELGEPPSFGGQSFPSSGEGGFLRSPGCTKPGCANCET